MSAGWLCWKAWNRARYYWPQAQARKRAEESLRAQLALHGLGEYRPRKQWWLP